MSDFNDYKPHGWGAPVDERRCRAAVPNFGRSVGFHQCSRKPMSGQKYCRQHSPEARAARIRASDERWEAEQKARKESAERNAVALLKRLGYTVTPPPTEEREP